jgi:hypothetical protein
MKVLLLANDGSARSAELNAKGRFTLTGSKGAMRKFFPRKGPGPTLHLMRNDVYVGPVLLAVKSNRLGFARLLGQAPARVKLGSMKVQKSGYVSVKNLAGKKATTKALRAKGVDTKRTVSLRKKVPLGAGTQGATGRLASTAQLRTGVSSALPPDATLLGSDADLDGVPNVADVDMNGDQILDAAQLGQPEQTHSDQVVGGLEVLENRPVPAAQVQKILNASPTAVVNSNVNPTVTWEQLTAYLNDGDNLVIGLSSNPTALRDMFCPGTSAAPCPAAERVMSIEVNCQALPYCSSRSQAVLRMGPDTSGTLLRDLLLPNGAFPLFQQTQGPAQYFDIKFLPKVQDRSALLFVGDAFEFSFKDAAGTELGRQATVVTSSVATPPVVTSIAGNDVAGVPDAAGSAVALPTDQMRNVPVEFYRPQRLDSQQMTAPAPVLIDRGGLEYGFHVGTGTGGEAYFCKPEQVTPIGSDLIALKPGPGPGGSRVARLFDQNLNPTNGGRLGVSINVEDCLNNPASGPADPPPAGSTVVLGISSFDSDDNRTSTIAGMRLP